MIRPSTKEPMVWLSRGALGICLAMMSGLTLLVLWKGLAALVRDQTDGTMLQDNMLQDNMLQDTLGPAIVGTVALTLLMSIAVMPLGVTAALYLREYAKPGPLLHAMRIAVYNLAGVPSIVFGVFGLGFFCHVIGVEIDQLLFSAQAPTPTYGKGGLLWASLTMALLTLPVVIVATEEAITSVPASSRQASYACGASKWQTVRRIVLPSAAPGILTGLILAVARAAGEVAPLILVGAVRYAPQQPIDAHFPFLHPQRSFMHLGFQIYDAGSQSQSSMVTETMVAEPMVAEPMVAEPMVAEPMVAEPMAVEPGIFTTILLLSAVIAALNIAAQRLRGRLRQQTATVRF